jgi:hypothetical protein
MPETREPFLVVFLAQSSMMPVLPGLTANIYSIYFEAGQQAGGR